MEQLFVFVLLLPVVIFLPYLTVNGESYSTIVPIDTGLNSTIKSGLRYGFQQTSECLNFQKAFLCVRKCLDLNFDIAYADKHCQCKCYYNRQKAKYTIKYNTTKTNWKLGAPTTSIPPWAQDRMKTKMEQPNTEVTEPNNVVDITDDDSGNDSDYSNSTDIVPASNETVTEITKDGISIDPLAKGTESSVPNGSTAADTGSGVVNGTIAVGSGSGVANSTATEAGTGSGGANSAATVAGTAAGGVSGGANATATVAGTAAVQDAAGKNETTTPAA